MGYIRPGSVSEEQGIEELVERARSRAFGPSMVAGIEEPPDFRGLTFAELVDLARRRAAGSTPENPVRQQSLRRARRLLGPEASEEQVDALAQKTHASVVLGQALSFRPEECARAPVAGEGVELLRRAGSPAILTFVHTTTSPIGFYALPRAAGRLIFVPNTRQPGQAPRTRMRQFWCEEHGSRYVDSGPLFEVLLALLAAGEVCALAADQPGDTDVTFFGYRAKTKIGGPVLAERSGAPVIVTTSWNDHEQFGIRLSRPLYAADFESPAAMQQEILHEVERQLNGDIARFVGDLELS
jgi:lauroyl/myristoyl acyltransferase